MTLAYVLDTTVLIEHAKGRSDGVEVLARVFAESSQIYTCDVTTSEALSGGLPEERELIKRLLEALEYIAIDPVAARWAGDQRRSQRAAGRRSPLGDALIAATAWRMDATIVTRNRADFESFGVPILAY